MWARIVAEDTNRLIAECVNRKRHHYVDRVVTERKKCTIMNKHLCLRLISGEK